MHGREDALLAACLGNTWAHCVNTRLVLQYAPQHAPARAAAAAAAAAFTSAPGAAPGATHGAIPAGVPSGRRAPGGGATAAPREVRVAKAPMCATASFGYEVGPVGLQEDEGWAAGLE